VRVARSVQLGSSSPQVLLFRALPHRELRAFRFVDGLVYYPHIGEYNEMQLVNGRWQKSQYRVVAGISRI